MLEITDDEIRALRRSADMHQDHAQVLICDAALGVPAAVETLPRVGFWRARGPWVLKHCSDTAGRTRYGWVRAHDQKYLGGTVAEIARVECALVKADAKATEEI